jgi:hypothetical protein
LIKGAILQASEYRHYPMAIGRALDAADTRTIQAKPDGTTALQFNKLDTKQKEAFDQTVEWVNHLTSKEGFKRVKTDIYDRGCIVELKRDQDAPVWARISVRAEILVDIDINDNRILSEHSNISVDWLIRHPNDERHNIAVTDEWPLTLSGLSKARRRLEDSLAKLQEWSLPPATSAPATLPTPAG